MFVCGASSAWVTCVLLVLLEVAVNPAWSSSSSWGGPFWLVHWECRQPAGTTEPGTLMLSAFYFPPTLWVFSFHLLPRYLCMAESLLPTPYLKWDFFLRLYFLRIFLGSQQNQEGQRFSIYSLLLFIPPPLSTSPTRVVRLFQLMNLHRHIIVTQSP